MANVGQGEIGNPHRVEGILTHPEEDDDPEVNSCWCWLPSDDNEGDEDVLSDSENGNGSPHRFRRPRCTQDPLEPQRHRVLVVPISNLHV